MDFKKLLQHSFETEQGMSESPPGNHLVFLSENVFNFTTYDREIDELFAKKAVEVCEVINTGKTFDYIKDQENYKWYLLMCNMPFFSEKLEWGGSIRGAWWCGNKDRVVEFDTCGFWDGDVQLCDTFRFNVEEWKSFITAVIDFSRS